MLIHGTQGEMLWLIAVAYEGGLPEAEHAVQNALNARWQPHEYRVIDPGDKNFEEAYSRAIQGLAAGLQQEAITWEWIDKSKCLMKTRKRFTPPVTSVRNRVVRLIEITSEERLRELTHGGTAPERVEGSGNPSGSGNGQAH